MKPFYMLVFFFIFFQLSALVIAGMAVFPEGTTLYTDFELEELEESATSPTDVIAYIFMGNGTTIGGIDIFGYNFAGFQLGSFSIWAIIGLLVVSGAIISRVAQSYVPAVLAVLGLAFLPMITHSTTFFYSLFTRWDSVSMLYLGITLIVGVLALFLITIIEIPTQGGS